MIYGKSGAEKLQKVLRVHPKAHTPPLVLNHNLESK